eukprot:TRINITY_DN21785_c0_g2_i1.p1 TRINITY_DN21785_c0_g2~~TRINITY_DN21785_c0_g2_i1.p1  ORF type:complete len:1040 (-),score=290.10 TRINITY_DN21785_c0_g2_i1:72-3110(-)
MKSTFVDNLREVLKGSVASAELKQAAVQWLADQDEEKSISHLKSTLLKDAAQSNSLALQDLARSAESVLSKRSFWLVGEDEWSFDISIASIHDILKGGHNVNVLVIDTTPLDDLKNPSKSYIRRKKDLGLYAMTYGNVYVASIALYSNYSHVLQVMKEADSYPGPSLVVAYAPGERSTGSFVRSETSLRILSSLKNTKRAVDEGHWPLYRWNPTLENERKDPFVLDSTHSKIQLEKFLERRSQLLKIVSPEPTQPEYLTHSLDGSLQASTQILLDSFKALSQGVCGGVPLMVLFASDGGNAEDVAQRLVKEGTSRGLHCQISAMDEFSIQELADEPNIVFVVSTAGQGEFPENGKETWKKLKQAAEESFSLENSKFAVFSLGDSHYWPRPGEEKYFCKAGIDLDVMLEKLGGQRLVSVGLGDDQHEDKFNTALGPWKQELWDVLGVGGAAVDPSELEAEKLPPDDVIKRESDFLRGTIAEGLVNESTGALALRDTKLTKFHGIYQQDDRDVRDSRRRQGLEKAYSFMIRVRVPGGGISPLQYLQMDDIASSYAMQTMKLTTRQTIQFHGVIKKELKLTIQLINKAVMDTIAACGDVCRNVMCNVNPGQSEVHREVYKFACDLSNHLTPNTTAYHEIWLDKVKVAGFQDFEPLYGETYLPRKFKVAIAVPPDNDADVFTNCLGYIAIVDNDSGKLLGYNVTVGGGLGTTHNNPKTYPCLAQVMGFVPPERAVDVGEKVMLVQRDYGDRTNRKHARLKYTLRDMGMDKFRAEVESRCGYKLEPAREFHFASNNDKLGWTRNTDGLWNYCLFVQNGRIRDWPDYALKTGLRRIAEVHTGTFRFTGNQNLMIASISDERKPVIESLLKEFNMSNDRKSGLRLNSMACTALPTCGLAFAESERYLPSLISKLDLELDKFGLRDEDITIRMTGCPNGCARPFSSEIGLVGRAPGIYNLHIGGGFAGERLNTLYKDGVNEQQIIHVLSPLFEEYSKKRMEGERFGDFCIRLGHVGVTSY